MLSLAKRLVFRQKKKLPLVRQTEVAECGLACLTMIAGYHGNHFSLNEIRHKFNLSIEGCTLLDLINISEKLHLTSRPLKLDLNRLVSLQTPCILHWNLNHFVVLKSVKNNLLTIYDPSVGEVRLTLADAGKHFTGVALELLPTTRFELKEGETKLRVSDFWTKIVGLNSSITLVLILSILLQLFVLAGPYYMQLVVDEVVLTGDTNLLIVLAIGFGGVLFFEIATSALRSFSLLHFENQLSVQMAANLFHHLVRLPMQYFEKRHMGDVLSRFGSFRDVKALLTEGIIEGIIDGIMAIFVFVVLALYSQMLTLIVLFAIVLYSVFRMLTFRKLKNMSEQNILANASEQSNFMESIRAIQTIKIFGSEAKREGIWQNHFINSTNKQIQIGIFGISYQAVNRAIFGVLNIVVIYIAAKEVLNANFSTGMLFAFMSYKNQFTDRIYRLIEKVVQYRMLSLHLDRISDIALSKREITHAESEYGKLIEGSLEVKDLSFSYSDNSNPVLMGVNCVIKAGESVAIVGASGCGKTSLMKIMLGLLKPEKGDVLIDGISIESFGICSYRKQVGAVMQDDQLLSGSIKENIAFFEDRIDMDWIIECCKTACIHEDILKMPMNYSSLIGDMGSALSGGQKQRLLLARALYRKPRILFLDEATSHLDTETESIVSDSIKKLKITRIIIAHRKETIQSVDRVIDISHISNQNLVSNLPT